MKKFKTVITFCTLALSLFMLHRSAGANQTSSVIEETKQFMNYNTEKKEKRFVIGIPIRTSNENGRFQKEAPSLWDKFYSENLIEKIPNKVDQNLLAVYTNYEGDYTKPFTYLIGCEVSRLWTPF
jgi:hypothetical protein